MAVDLILGQWCNGCGSTTDLYGSSCKHLTLCLSCGKSMAEKGYKCCHCHTPITRLIRFPNGKSNRCAAESNMSYTAPLKKVKIESTEDYIPPVLVPKKEAPEEEAVDIGAVDLILGQSCNGCGSTTELYGSSCKHLTLCLSCGKSMAEKGYKCCHCDTPITRLIREYNVRVISNSDTNYCVARCPDGLPEFKKNQKWFSQRGPKGSQYPCSVVPKYRNKALLLGEETSHLEYVGLPFSLVNYWLLVHQGNELVTMPVDHWYSFDKIVPRKQQSSKYAEEKMKYNKAHVSSVKAESSDGWMEEYIAPKEEPADSSTRNRCAAESNTSYTAALKKVKIEYTEDYIPPVFVSKKEAPEEEAVDSSRTWSTPSSFKFPNDKIDASAKESNASNSALLKNMKIQNEVKSAKADTASSMRSSTPAAPPALSENGSELPTGPVSEDEIRAVLLHETAVTAQDLVDKFKSRLMLKENKNAFASTLKRISRIRNINGVKFIVLRKKLDILDSRCLHS